MKRFKLLVILVALVVLCATGFAYAKTRRPGPVTLASGNLTSTAVETHATGTWEYCKQLAFSVGGSYWYFYTDVSCKHLTPGVTYEVYLYTTPDSPENVQPLQADDNGAGAVQLFKGVPGSDPPSLIEVYDPADQLVLQYGL